ncbi:GTP-binding protein, partial [bacterium]|nr:GTP-binding protein [bacterium]
IGENDDEGTAEEYGISTYVYYRRRAFDKDRFTDWAETDYGRKVIRTKGIVYFTEEPDDVYIYEQAGKQKYLSPTGKWYAASLSKRQIQYYLKTDPQFAHDWDPDYGDRMIKLVFIGQDLDRKEIKKELDEI